MTPLLLNVILMLLLGFAIWLTRSLATFLRNLALIWVFGFVLAVWFIRYTDLFETAAGLFVLVGVLSWLASLAGRILPAKQADDLLNTFRSIFATRRTTRLLVVLLIGFFVFVNFFGTLRIEVLPRAEAVGMVVQSDDSEPEFYSLDRASLDLPLQAVPFFLRPTRFEIKVEGYPTKRVEVSGLSHATVRIPESLYRRVVLVMPMPDLMRDPFKYLEVTVTDKQGVKRDSKKIPDYAGNSFWVGTNQIEIPAEIKTRLRSEMDEAASDLANGLGKPFAEIQRNLWEQKRFNPLESTLEELKPGDKVTYEYVRTAGNKPSKASAQDTPELGFCVEPPPSGTLSRTFIQVVFIDLGMPVLTSPCL